MRVSELIDMLQHVNQDSFVHFTYWEDGIYTAPSVESVEENFIKDYPHNPTLVTDADEVLELANLRYAVIIS